jgi:hypothetical protein
MAYGKLKTEHKVLLRDDERNVLRAFGRKPNLCIHEIFNLTGIPYPDLTKLLKTMISRGDIIQAPELSLGKGDLQFVSKKESTMSTVQFVDERLSPLIGLSEQGMRGRVIMLKRMKRNLISDWHPVIDVLLNDYERDLKRMERLREPPDADDVLDRDIDDEG